MDREPPFAEDIEGSGLEGSRFLPWILAGLLLLGLVIRLVDLGAGLWLDEILTKINYVDAPLSVTLTTFDSQNQHMLYSVLANLTTALAGDGVGGLRLPAVLFGVASLWAVYHFGRRVTSRTEAVLAAAFLTVSYHHVWFSQNARGYTGLLLWTLLSSAAFVDLLRNRESRRTGLAIWYGATIALGLYTHLTAAVVPLAHVFIGAVAIAGRDGKARPTWQPLALGFAAAGTLTALIYAPVLTDIPGVLFAGEVERVEREWTRPLWLLRETARGLARGVPGGIWTILAGSFVAAVGVASYVRRSLAVAAIMLLPPIVTAAAIIVLGHNLWPRFFFFVAGFAILIGLRGIFALARALSPGYGDRIAVALCLLAAAGSLSMVPRAWGPKQDFAGAERFVARSLEAGDRAVVTSLTAVPLRDYLGRTDWEIVESAPELERIEAASARTWLLYTLPVSLEAYRPELWERIQTVYAEAGRFPGTVRGGDVVVMVRE